MFKGRQTTQQAIYYANAYWSLMSIQYCYKYNKVHKEQQYTNKHKTLPQNTMAFIYRKSIIIYISFFKAIICLIIPFDQMNHIDNT